jgi:hypothetical protein
MNDASSTHSNGQSPLLPDGTSSSKSRVSIRVYGDSTRGGPMSGHCIPAAQGGACH